MTENAITPDEAREAVGAIVIQTGHVMERLHDYCPKKDRFIIEARNTEGKLIQITVYGETVARVVAMARNLAGTLGKPLLRPSEVEALRREVLQ
jgi:predicted kinase